MLSLFFVIFVTHFTIYIPEHQKSKLPVRELVPERNPVFLYQDLEGKKHKTTNAKFY